jgi:type II secretory pathway pseudopilin PulG
MKITARRKRERGFTLIEMIAALIGAVVIIGAATGFMLTAAIRQYKVLSANALEAQHESLAEAMSASIKSATAFQIYATDPGIKFGSPLPPGESPGNLLVCVRSDLVEVFAFYDASTIGGTPLFDTNLGIIQAHWNVTTSFDLVPFSVYGLPIPMQ